MIRARSLITRPRAEGRSAQKFNTRYATFGFSDTANLDEGARWPTAFALKKLTAAEEARLAALAKKHESRDPTRATDRLNGHV